MFLEGMSKEDCKLLDTMWALESSEELNGYLKTLSDADFLRAVTLIELLRLSAVDDEVNAMKTYPEAEAMLRSIMQ